MALLVKKSQIPNSGKGLFTNKDIKKGAKIIEYRGEILDEKEFNIRADKKETYYVFFVKKNLYIDPMRTPQYKARYANDAAGSTRVKGFRNNSYFDVIDDRCFIIASRKIKAGEEIFVSYTKSYWSYIKKQDK